MGFFFSTNKMSVPLVSFCPYFQFAVTLGLWGTDLGSVDQTLVSMLTSFGFVF
jgi:hypothetical protein